MGQGQGTEREALAFWQGGSPERAIWQAGSLDNVHVSLTGARQPYDAFKVALWLNSEPSPLYLINIKGMEGKENYVIETPGVQVSKNWLLGEGRAPQVLWKLLHQGYAQLNWEQFQNFEKGI